MDKQHQSPRLSPTLSQCYFSLAHVGIVLKLGRSSHYLIRNRLVLQYTAYQYVDLPDLTVCSFHFTCAFTAFTLKRYSGTTAVAMKVALCNN